MTLDDFKSYGIRYFTPDEVRATGADIKDVKPRLMQHLDRFRGVMDTPVKLIKNGMTTGSHTAREHKDGLAVDITMAKIEPGVVFKIALECGFKGIGLYWSRDKWVSVHLDLRTEYAFWRAKKERGDMWTYYPLIGGME